MYHTRGTGGTPAPLAPTAGTLTVRHRHGENEDQNLTITAGLDVGGAHLKVALVEDGLTLAVEQFLCPLWQGLDKLDAALAAAKPLTSRAKRHAVTMTGELSDLFPDRKSGVEALVQRIAKEFGPKTRFWMGARGFGAKTDALKAAGDVGSTNFLASAAFVARQEPDALLIDFGSTTVDIIPIVGGKPVPRGLTDAERQTTGELVYTGLTRTAVMGVASQAPFKGRWVGLAREYLANMADVRRILGELPENVDLHATADGKGKSRAESVTRFARMLGCDAAAGTLADWAVAAAYVREQQMRSIHDGALQVLSASALKPGAPVVTAGIGADAAAVIALRLARGSIAFGTLAKAEPAAETGATHAAPAVAVAMLLDA